jgi:23S rRNA pseudouridine1911/1915/1917 synthase
VSALSTLYDYSSLEEALLENLNISRSQLKKRANLKKSILERHLEYKAEYAIPTELFNYGLVSPVYMGPEVEVISSPEPFIVLNKPARVHSHPLHYNEQNNILSFLRSKNLDKSLGFYNLSYDRGLLHRLDFETSGVILYCKDEELRRDYFEQREKLILNKIYYALAKPNILKPGLLSHQLDLSGDKVRQVKNSSNSSKDVSLEILQVVRGKGVDLVKIKLFGGARHQIRAQLSFSGAPILGDELYGGDKSSRLFLHSASYTIIINEEAKEFSAKLPSSFGDFLDLNSIS